MSLPGSTVAISDAPASPPTQDRSGALSLIGTSERGPAVPVPISSPRQLLRRFGKDVSYGDIVPLGLRFFERGGRFLLVRRDQGPGATYGSVTLNDSTPAATLKFTTNEAGAWSTTATLQCIAGQTAGTVRLAYAIDGEEVDRSPECSTKAQLEAWKTPYGFVELLAGVGLPVVGSATALSAGNDDRASISITTFQGCLDSLTTDMAGGQIAAPAYRQAAHRAALAKHGKDHFRFALPDIPDTSTVSTIKTAVADIAAADRKFAQPVGPNLSAPVLGVPRPTPASIDLAAAYAVSDREANGYPHRAAAGLARGVIEDGTPARTWAEADLDTLNEAGVTIARVYRDQLAFMGARTASARAGEEDAPGMRVVLQMARDMQIVIDGAVFDPDTEAQEIVGRCAAIAVKYFGVGAIVGKTPADACRLTWEVVPVSNAAKRLVINASVLPPGFLERIDLTIGKRF